MKLTRNLWIFTILNLVSTILFLTFLKNGVSVTKVSDNPASYVSWMPTVYFIVWFFSGLILGYLDKPRKTRHDIDFMYSLVTLIIMTLGAIYYVVLFKEFHSWLYTLALAWLVQLIYWYFVKRRIKGTSKKDTFK